ncbi:MAG: acetamidase [Sphingomonadales bacterium]|nr:MAG: acetamidase [Sphingomonadales bacterium]TNF02253.1 MAG: acetamidase [Sphingomonadales bacterium]
MSQAKSVVEVSEYSGGIVGPGVAPADVVTDGGTIRTGTPPGCWGPMITPKFQGGHEVTRPVMVEGAEIGDAIAIKLKKVQVTSLATSSGVMEFVEGRYRGDPFVAKQCSACGAISPASHIEGIGDEAVRCDNCGAEVSAFRFSNGYVIVLDRENGVSVTVDQEVANRIAGDADIMSALPGESAQHSILSLARADIAGLTSRMRPFLGNIGTSPSKDLPDSHNAGDFGAFLIGAPHDYAMTEEELNQHKTDGHMDTNSVREGAILICPVKIPGGGIYMGDMHAQQGNGEIAGHATDVSGEVEVEVEVIKGLAIDGPMLLQRPDDLPPLAQPFSAAERSAVTALAGRWGQKEIEVNGPITFIGSGKTLNDATTNGLERASKVTGLPFDEILNRATIAGSIEISRLPGVVRVTFMCPKPILEKLGIAHLVEQQYGVMGA